MTQPSIRKAMLFFCLLGVSCLYAQDKPVTPVQKTSPAKPFKLLTNNRQITIQSKEEIRSLLVWTASGHRIVEQKDIKTTSHSFTVPPKESIIFLLIETSDGKRYTEKLGVR